MNNIGNKPKSIQTHLSLNRNGQPIGLLTEKNYYLFFIAQDRMVVLISKAKHMEKFGIEIIYNKVAFQTH